MSKVKRPDHAQLFGTLIGRTVETAQSVRENLAINQIRLRESQPRKYIDPKHLEELADSISRYGILQPLLVRPIGNSRYELVAGERRYRAAQLAKLTRVPVAIRNLDEDQAHEVALIENLQREDLNPIEETYAFLDLLARKLHVERDKVPNLLYQRRNTAKRGDEVRDKAEVFTIIDLVFEAIGTLSLDSFVSNRLPLLKLPEDILAAVQMGQIAYTKALAIAKVRDEGNRQALLMNAIEEDLSLNQVRARVRALNSSSNDDVATTGTLNQRASHLLKRVKGLRLGPDDVRHQRISNLLEELETLLLEAN